MTVYVPHVTWLSARTDSLSYKDAANGKTLTDKAIPVQQQAGGEDCGLFSIAFAYHAALGEDLM